LGANALDEDAVRCIFEAKGRPQDNPLIIHVPNDVSWLERYCADVPESAYRLAEKFWPGPLTMILRRKDIVPLRTTGGLDTVGIRCPDHAVTEAIIKKAGVPIAAPSANLSGRPSCTTAAHVLEDMAGKIPGIVDGGSCAVGVESTIIDLTVTPPHLLRPGGMPLEALEEVLGEIRVDKAVVSLLSEGEKPRAPGMKYRHYAPKAPVTVVTGKAENSAKLIAALLRKDMGVICFEEYLPLFAEMEVRSLGSKEDKLSQAQQVFDALRAFDETSVSAIFAQCPDNTGLGLAVGNRLKKAAGFQVIDADVLAQKEIFGITGLTGAGKTTLLKEIERVGGFVVDCDAFYYEELAAKGDLYRALKNVFPAAFSENGELDRAILGNIVFGNEAELSKLNAVIYAHLPKAILAKAAQRSETLIALDAINLFESGLAALCDRTVAVTAPEEVRLARIMARDGIDRERAQKRIAAQKQETYYRLHCDAVIENVGSEQEFAALAAELLSHQREEIRRRKTNG
ncbi:MAG: threonylcarbamoyl-AMP synthase, partial [Oscillospiraceae bacterium]|nr:threonylcarbamoyl-AMP synthase [Oscillospiraceae bacterium]